MGLFLKILKAVAIAVPAGIVVIVSWICICAILRTLTRSTSERIALTQFKADHPELKPGFTGRQRDDDLDIVMIAYGSTRLHKRMYYAVASDGIAHKVQDDAKYRPQPDR